MERAAKKKDTEDSEEQKEAGKASQTQSNSYDVHGDLSRESKGGQCQLQPAWRPSGGDLQPPQSPRTANPGNADLWEADAAVEEMLPEQVLAGAQCPPGPCVGGLAMTRGANPNIIVRFSHPSPVQAGPEVSGVGEMSCCELRAQHLSHVNYTTNLSVLGRGSFCFLPQITAASKQI